MPLLFKKQVASNTCLAVWHITETEEQLARISLFPSSLIEEIATYKSCERRLEKLAVYAILHVITGNNKAQITYNAVGKPLCNQGFISITHTKEYAAIILSQTKKVSIDLEYISNRIEKIRSKFLRDDEIANTLPALLLHWTAKETLYKFASEDNLALKEMKLQPFNANTSGVLSVENLKRKTFHQVYYEMNNCFVLTYICE